MQNSALLYYDYALTVPSEVQCIWKRKFSGASALFLINRYVSLLVHTLLWVQMLPRIDEAGDINDSAE